MPYIADKQKMEQIKDLQKKYGGKYYYKKGVTPLAEISFAKKEDAFSYKMEAEAILNDKPMQKSTEQIAKENLERQQQQAIQRNVASIEKAVKDYNSIDALVKAGKMPKAHLELAQIGLKNLMETISKGEFGKNSTLNHKEVEKIAKSKDWGAESQVSYYSTTSTQNITPPPLSIVELPPISPIFESVTVENLPSVTVENVTSVVEAKVDKALDNGLQTLSKEEEKIVDDIITIEANNLSEEETAQITEEKPSDATVEEYVKTSFFEYLKGVYDGSIGNILKKIKHKVRKAIIAFGVYGTVMKTAKSKDWRAERQESY
jgi:hypothetical protein